jgi:allantoicase
LSAADSPISTPPGLIDLASARLGGVALLANDEFFAEKENLLKPGRGIFIPEKYTERGKWMDGWETRRRRTPGNDWCVVRLGLRGVIRRVDIDTNHFLGNHPPFASLDALSTPAALPNDPAAIDTVSWTPLLPKSPLNPGSQNLFDLTGERAWTYVRLNIFPDGGVARLRVYGIVVPDCSRVKAGELVDLAAIQNGGVALACSDMFFSSMNNLIMPGRAQNMGDGWETKRRRGPGHDWIILKLGSPGTIRSVEVDTAYFKGNYPDMCSIEGCSAADAPTDELNSGGIAWKELLPKTNLQPDTRHFFEREVLPIETCTHVRLNIYPDGGVSRLRLWGTVP